VQKLKDLFEIKEEVEEQPKIESLVQAQPNIENLPKERNDIGSPTSESLSNIFRAHRITQDTEEGLELPFEPETSSDEIEIQENQPTENIPSQVGRQLQKAGWSIQINFSSGMRRGTEPDIQAEKGLIRKKKKLIFIAEDPTDAEICGFLLQSSLEEGEKIVYLIEGNPQEVNISHKIKLVTQINQIL
jgi:hypothetical protein